MKQSLFIARLRGYVRIQIRGKDCERLIHPMVEGASPFGIFKLAKMGSWSCTSLSRISFDFGRF